MTNFTQDYLCFKNQLSIICFSNCLGQILYSPHFMPDAFRIKMHIFKLAIKNRFNLRLNFRPEIWNNYTKYIIFLSKFIKLFRWTLTWQWSTPVIDERCKFRWLDAQMKEIPENICQKTSSLSTIKPDLQIQLLKISWFHNGIKKNDALSTYGREPDF